MRLLNRIEELEKELLELKELVKEEQDFPKDGDIYWLIDDEGNVFNTFYDNHYIDRYHQLIGNVFKTKEQAEFAVEKLKVEAELRKYSRPFERGRFNHYIFIDTDGNHLKVNSLIYGQPQGTIYFESEEKVQQAIKSVGEERIKKYIFGVED